MFAQEKSENVEVLSDGHRVMKNSDEPPTIIKGFLFKEGHIVKVSISTSLYFLHLYFSLFSCDRIGKNVCLL
jgi:hypothetical protein